MASVRLCTRTRAVHRPRMELFVGYSRRVEDEWFWREKRESFSTLPATRDRGIFNGVTWYLSWLDLCLPSTVRWISTSTPPSSSSLPSFFNSLGSFYFLKKRKNSNVKYSKRIEMSTNTSKRDMSWFFILFSTLVLTKWTRVTDRNISF